MVFIMGILFWIKFLQPYNRGCSYSISAKIQNWRSCNCFFKGSSDKRENQVHCDSLKKQFQMRLVLATASCPIRLSNYWSMLGTGYPCVLPTGCATATRLSSCGDVLLKGRKKNLVQHPEIIWERAMRSVCVVHRNHCTSKWATHEAHVSEQVHLWSDWLLECVCCCWLVSPFAYGGVWGSPTRCSPIYMGVTQQSTEVWSQQPGHNIGNPRILATGTNNKMRREYLKRI